MDIHIINGPNLNFLGIREPKIYGYDTLEDLEEYMKRYKEEHQVDTNLYFFQSNSEGEIIDYLHTCYEKKVEGIIINPAAYTHYSIAIRDAISSVMIPCVEVHLSDIHEREDFRKHSVMEEVCVKQICGKKFAGYTEALDFLINYITNGGARHEK